MVLLNVGDWEVDGVTHLFWPEEKEETDTGMSLFAEPVRGEGTRPQSELVPASRYPQAMAEEWEHADKVDGLGDLLTRLTVDGHMCQECVNIYREDVGGIKHLGRKYYPDEHDVEESEIESLARDYLRLVDATEYNE